jgi:Cdc6-like AAA superfamily ATPase
MIDEEEEAEILCNAQIELAPNQQFVRNFLSVETPYNSLLLYHGLGTGKTCSAISVAEEMRDYMKQMGITQQIIVIASPNVQENFRLQLFDERELREIEPGVWNIRACTGNKFIKEINPMNMKGLTRDKIVKQIQRLISSHYLFFGYNEFANYARTQASSIGISQDDAVIEESRRRKANSGAAGAAAKKSRNSAADVAKAAEMETLTIESLSVAKLRKLFANTLIIIDEVHNIRITDDNRDKRVAKILYQIVQKVNNVRLLLLSGTPMYNSYKEIVWLINLMNLNDRRATIDIADVFDDRGNFRVDSDGQEIGKDLLVRKATGYVSFVRGENPYTFPYRIYPREHSPEFSLLERLRGGGGGGYPRTQLKA